MIDTLEPSAERPGRQKGPRGSEALPEERKRLRSPDERKVTSDGQIGHQGDGVPPPPADLSADHEDGDPHAGEDHAVDALLQQDAQVAVLLLGVPEDRTDERG